MFVRIVKLSFHPEKVEEFLSIFDKKKEFIRGYEGCSLLEVYRDKTNPNVFFTYSYWEKEDHLENYRNSVLFRGIWAKIKVLFNDKPLAWSVDKTISLK
ncbi:MULTISPECIES: putative quinol monooxygenase [Tenacibaculum]|uniref:putative quinol monooxygenase n=1 Tax=Tenacibaculum TaxID=104267 RepID=UPI001F0B0E6E|nr:MULTISPECIES: antibiotic biosynthesis monooxygenase family protein [Tenacibaculum]MCH3883302.1 antibiotic biosynthesis monooxygenase [Tenacibaculum aquimarinum]MDO6600342.1 antibiotic biosynthesis monooxygenase family protein [Tenacibaculum sp. 1_MG-2023]